jgi:hypothetical protein
MPSTRASAGTSSSARDQANVLDSPYTTGETESKEAMTMPGGSLYGIGAGQEGVRYMDHTTTRSGFVLNTD